MTYIPQQLRITPIDGWERPKSDTNPAREPIGQGKGVTPWTVLNADTKELNYFKNTEELCRFFGVVHMGHLSTMAREMSIYRLRYFFYKGSNPSTDWVNQCVIKKKEMPIDRKRREAYSKKAVQFMDLWGNVKNYESVEAASKILNIGFSSIYNCVSGITKSTNGYLIKYVKNDKPWNKLTYWRITNLLTGEEKRTTAIGGIRQIVGCSKEVSTSLSRKNKVYNGFKIEKEELN